jgi:hypothetical protein
MGERLAQAEISRQRERRHQLRQTDVILRPGPFHDTSLDPTVVPFEELAA